MPSGSKIQSIKIFATYISHFLKSTFRIWNRSEIGINDLEKPTRLMKRSTEEESSDSLNNQQLLATIMNNEYDLINSLVTKSLMRLWNKKEMKLSLSQI